jgi:hypothetical protein
MRRPAFHSHCKPASVFAHVEIKLLVKYEERNAVQYNLKRRAWGYFVVSLVGAESMTCNSVSPSLKYSVDIYFPASVFNSSADT